MDGNGLGAAVGKVLGDLVQRVGETARGDGAGAYKDHQSDAEDYSLPLQNGDTENAITVALPQIEALSETDWLSSIEDNLHDADFAEDLFTDAAEIDAYGDSPTYPTTGPPDLVRHVYEFPMSIALPEGLCEPVDTFSIPVPPFEQFGDRRVIMLGCALDPDGDGCLFNNCDVPMMVSLSVAPYNTALLRARPSSLVAPLDGLLPDMSLVTLAPGDQQGEVVNGTLVSSPSTCLSKLLGTGDQFALQGETRGLQPVMDQIDNGAAAGKREIGDDEPVYVARNMRSFASILDYAQNRKLPMSDAQQLREALFLHHGQEYVLPHRHFDAVARHTFERWQRRPSQQFFLTIKRMDGRQWQPTESHWKVSLSVLFEFCCANN